MKNLNNGRSLYIAAVSDIHGRKYLPLYIKSLNEIRHVLNDIIVLVLAGDIVLKGDVNSASDVVRITLNTLKSKPIIACIGNEEYDSILDELFRRYNKITWLNDNYFTLNVENMKIALIGSRGALDRPTPWQRRHIPRIEKVYRERVEKIERLIEETKRTHDVIVLITHYAPTFKTLKGEPQRIWPEMGSSRLEEVIIKTKPHLVIHGHAHNSKVLYAEIDGVKVYNVSLPATKRITLINLREIIVKRKTTTLLDYFKV